MPSTSNYDLEVADEAMRDRTRPREEAICELRDAQFWLKAFLLRHGIRDVAWCPLLL